MKREEVKIEEAPSNEKAAVAEKKEHKKFDKNEFFRVLKFVGFSISAGVIQLGSFEILYHAINWNNWWACYLISIILSVIWNFTFNRKFTFQSANNIYIAMGWTLLYYAAFIPISVFGGDALESIGWHGTLVTVLMMLLNFVTEFLWQRLFVFRKSINSKPLAKTVHMHLQSQPFESIASGKKTVEMRLFDDKRKDLHVGDKIIFTKDGEENQKLKVKITKLNKFASFTELYDAYEDKGVLGYGPDDKADPKDMEKYYTDQQQENGVLAIEFELKK